MQKIRVNTAMLPIGFSAKFYLGVAAVVLGIAGDSPYRACAGYRSRRAEGSREGNRVAGPVGGVVGGAVGAGVGGAMGRRQGRVRD